MNDEFVARPCCLGGGQDRATRETVSPDHEAARATGKAALDAAKASWEWEAAKAAWETDQGAWKAAKTVWEEAGGLGGGQSGL